MGGDRGWRQTGRQGEAGPLGAGRQRFPRAVSDLCQNSVVAAFGSRGLYLFASGECWSLDP